MLHDWLERLLTTCPLHLRDMGCLREMLGIRRRRRRHRDAWAPHCRRSQGLVLAAAARCRRRRKAVVLGSGWLHDVPLDELTRLFREVTLVDLFHPFSVRRQARKFANVRLVEADVTETLLEVWRVGHRPDAALPQVTPTRFVEEADLDLTVSLNLLSQLPCMPENFLRRLGAVPADAVLAYCRGVIESHLDYLRALPGVVALLTDVEVRTVTAAGELVSRADSLYGVPLPWRGETWDWTLVPPGRHHAQVLTVVGVEDVKDTKRG
jgi:hypothetical protein